MSLALPGPAWERAPAPPATAVPPAPSPRPRAAAPIAFRVLGSGSRGNATLLELGPFPDGSGGPAGPRPHRLLLDAGFSPRRTAAALADDGLGLDDLDGMLLTHADRDHFHPGWVRVSESRGLPVHAHRRHRGRLTRRGLTGRSLRIFEGEPFGPAGADADAGEEARGPRLEPVLCVHDDTGSAAFVIEHRGTRLGWATDLGRVPPRLLARFADLDAVAIESNHDPDLQRASGRPAFLQDRIMGGSGHLDNERALDAVLAVDGASPGGLRHVVLLHLSRDCNCPRLVRSLWERRAAHLAPRLVLTEQDAPSPWIVVHATRERMVQASLFGERSDPAGSSNSLGPAERRTGFRARSPKTLASRPKAP